MVLVKELKRRLNDWYKDDEEIAVAIWTVDDIKTQAESMGIKIKKKDAEQILYEIDKHQDSSIGISWDTLGCYLDDFRKVGPSSSGIVVGVKK